MPSFRRTVTRRRPRNWAPPSLTTSTPTSVIANAPASVASGVAIAPAITVTVKLNGVTDTSYTGNVTATIATGIGTLANAVVAAVAGVATFTNLAVTGDGGGYTLTFTPAGGVYPAATTGAFFVLGTAMNADLALVTALGGNANVAGFYDRRLSLGVSAGAVATIDDAIGAYGGRTPGPQWTQATGGNRPALSGVQGSGTERITLASASQQHMTTAASFPAFSATTPLYVVTIGKLTANGYLAGLAADPTSAATYPYAMVEGAGGNWKSDVARSGSGNRSQADTGVAWNDGLRRVSVVGKATQFASGHGNFAEEWLTFFGARQPQYFATMNGATAGAMKGSIGRLGATYADGEIDAVIVLKVDPTQAMIQAIYAYAAAQHGATIDATKSRTLINAGSSLVYGSQSSDPVSFAPGSGTTSFPYVASRLNTGPRGTWIAQGLDVGDAHSFNYGVSGADYVGINSRFDTLIAPAVDGYRAGPFVLVCMEIGNTIETNTFSAAQVLAEMTTLRDKVHALGGKLYHFTCGDRGGGGLTNFGWYNSIGGALSTQGQVALDVNAALRATPLAYGDGYIEHELSAGDHFRINRAGSHASDDTTYFQSARVHYTDTGYALAGAQEKDFFDATNALGFPLARAGITLGSSRLRRHRQTGERTLITNQRPRRIQLVAMVSPTITAQALATLPALSTASATAVLLIAASTVANLPALSMASGTAVLPVQANAVASLPALSTVGATGTLLVTANALATMPALTSVATVQTNFDVDATALATLPALSTASATASLTIGASSVATMPALSSVASAVLLIGATAAATMPPLTAITAVKLLIAAQAIAVLPALRAFTSIIVGTTTALSGRVAIYPQLSARTRIFPSS